ncbi:hypothetical protein ACFUN8_15365 [Streptomyces sp. NPDC057307]|uniref:hypothetical protein n=1 Tax=Streptomyces sp. NPDC057307 TaxID=3346096 RepID=UPI003641B8A7
MTRRTRTTALLLLGVAVGGASACVAVEPEAGAAPDVGAVRAEAPTPGAVEPQIVQPSAREVLEAAAPPRRTLPARPAVTDSVQPSPEPPRRRTAVRPPAPPAPSARPVPAAPTTALPDLDAGLCALGTRYGGWAPGSPESRLCERTYGD